MSASCVRRFARDTRGATYVEYLILVGVVGLVALGGFRAFGGSLRRGIARDAACVASLDASCATAAMPAPRMATGFLDTTTSGSSSASAATAAAGESATAYNEASVLGSVGAGIGDFAVDSAMAVWNTARHPIDTAEGIGTAVAHPVATASSIGGEIADAWRRDKVRTVTRGVLETATLGSAAFGAYKVVRGAAGAAEASRVARVAAAISGAGDDAAQSVGRWFGAFMDSGYAQRLKWIEQYEPYRPLPSWSEYKLEQEAAAKARTDYLTRLAEAKRPTGDTFDDLLHGRITQFEYDRAKAAELRAAQMKAAQQSTAPAPGAAEAAPPGGRPLVPGDPFDDLVAGRINGQQYLQMQARAAAQANPPPARAQGAPPPAAANGVGDVPQRPLVPGDPFDDLMNGRINGQQYFQKTQRPAGAEAKPPPPSAPGKPPPP